MYSNQRRKKGVAMHFYCTMAEQVYIKSCAKKSGRSVSDHLRRGAIKGFAGRDKSLPMEVLAFQGQLAQVCGLLEVIARKRLDEEDLNALDRAQLTEVRRLLQEFLEQIKNHLI